jgi:hypothetical protein
MKFLKIGPLLFFFLLLVNFSNANTPFKKKWSKNVWTKIELNQKINSPIFLPFNENLPGFDYGNQVFDDSMYYRDNSAINWNLWTIISRAVMNTDLILYSPYNPEWYATKDNGFLNYPILPNVYGRSEKGNFFNDDKFYRTCIDYDFLGRELFDANPEPIISVEYPGEDSIDNNGDFVYYPFDIYFYQDKDIESYMLREKWILNINGEVVDKEILAIAPIVNNKDSYGNVVGEKELFWVDFKVLIEKIKPYYILLDRYKQERVISYFDFFNDREFYSEIIEEKIVQVKLE